MNRLLSKLLCIIVCAGVVQGGGGPVIDPECGWIYATTFRFGFPNEGSLVAFGRTTPFEVVALAGLDSWDARVARYGGEVYVVEPDTALIRVFAESGVELRSFSVGAGTSPRDFVVVGGIGYVTRANSTHLYRVDPVSGVGQDVVDLSVFADADGVPDMERMAVHGGRLFVQLRRIGALERGFPFDPGAIAVVDLATETLVDADPGTAEIDAIELVGPAPRLRMYVDPAGAFLLVSATDGHHLSFNGGIEKVNLQTLASDGFVEDEMSVAAMGGFAMKNSAEGYLLFHTDIVASNHLTPFTVESGTGIGQDIITDLGAYVDSVVFDPTTGYVYMGGSLESMHIVDTATDLPHAGSPVAMPGIVVDQVLGPGRDGDANGDWVVDVDDVSYVLFRLGGSPPDGDVNGDGGIDVNDISYVLFRIGDGC